MEWYPYIITIVLAVSITQTYKLGREYLRNRSIRLITLFDLKHNPDALLTSVISVFLATIIVGNTTSEYTVLLVLLGWLAVERLDWFSSKAVLFVPFLISILAALLSTIGYWGGGVALLDATSGEQANHFLIWSIALLVVSEATILSIRKSKLRKLPTSRRIIRGFRFSYSIPAVLSLGIVSAQMQFNTTVLDSRFWYFLAFTTVIVATGLSYKYIYRQARQHLIEEAEHFNKQHKAQKKKSKRKK